MKISERYQTARHTTNLKSVPRTRYSASDVLGAAGMAGQDQSTESRNRDNSTALLLWEAAFRGKTQAKMALVESLSKDLLMMMMRARIDGDPRVIAQEVLAWFLYGTCGTCKGRGYQVILGTNRLSDRVCTACRGTKTVKLPRSEPHDWLHDRVSKLQAIAGGRIMAKLADDLSDFS